MRADGRLVPDGVNVQYKPHHGPLAKWMAAQGQLDIRLTAHCFKTCYYLMLRDHALTVWTR